MKELYLAGKKDLLQELFLQVKGVEQVEPGCAISTDGEKLLGVKITYNPKKQDISGILREYVAIVDPFAVMADPDEQPGVFYSSSEDVMQLEYYARFLQSRGHEPGAALGNLIMNDSITPGQEIRPLQLRFGRAAGFEAD